MNGWVNFFNKCYWPKDWKILWYVNTGQTQQVVTQIIRGQPVSTAVSSPTTVSTSQKVATAPGIPSQHMQPQAAPPHPPRPQQGQVKLTMAQLTQLTQGQVSNQDLGDRDSYNEQRITVSPPQKGIFIRKSLRQRELSVQWYSTEFQQHRFRISRSCKMGFGELLLLCCLEWIMYSEKKTVALFKG